MSASKINFKTLINKNREEILRKYLNLITIDGRSREVDTDLKIYIFQSYKFNPSQISSKIEDYYVNEIDQEFKKFIDRHAIRLSDLGNSNYYLRIENTFTKKKYDFLIFKERSYWILITLIKKEDLRSTFLRFVKKFNEIERIKIVPRQLESLIHEKGYSDQIKGFIAKFKPYHSERKITVNVYGGDLIDLEKIREIFFVEPTKFEYQLKNSPIGVLKGGIFNDGYFTLSEIKRGYQNLAIEKINEFINSFIDINEIYFEKVKDYENTPILLENKYNSLMLKSRYRLTIKIKDKRIKKDAKNERDTITFKDLDKKIFEYFKNRHSRYEIYSEKQFSHFICDKRTRNKVQLTIEPRDNNIILYPFKNCMGLTIRDICNGINKVESSIEALNPMEYSL
jgi:hypothetical protein